MDSRCRCIDSKINAEWSICPSRIRVASRYNRRTTFLHEDSAVPIHDWTRVDAGIFHDFHHAWIEQIKRALNRGVLPPEYYAMAEQITGNIGPDVLTLERPVY